MKNVLIASGLSLTIALAGTSVVEAQSPPVPPPPLPAPASPSQVIDLPLPNPASSAVFESHPGQTSLGQRQSAFLTSIDYLLVRPYRRDTDFTVVDTFNGGWGTSSESVGLDLASGLRFMIGYRTSQAWELLLTYTYIHSSGNNTVVAPSGGSVYPTLLRPAGSTFGTIAAGTANLNYNVYDLETARTFCHDDSLALRFTFGPRIASIEQSLAAYYQGGTADGAMIGQRTDFNGGGLTGSAQADWLLGSGFRIYGRARASLLAGEKSNSLGQWHGGPDGSVSERYTAIVPVLEFGTGLAWEYRNVRLSVGYEIANWMNLTDSLNFSPNFPIGRLSRQTSDLSLEGVSFQLGFVY